MRIPEGSIVVALVDIHDDASNREIPQHAQVGDLGIVEWYDDDDFPTINWGKGTGFGVYDSHKSQPETYDTCDESHGKKKFNPIRITPPYSAQTS